MPAPTTEISREMMLDWRPMKAATAPHDWRKKEWPHHIVELKLNGDRTLMACDNTGARFFTRTLSRADDLPVEKTACLPHLTQMWTEGLSIFDGEIVVSGDSSHTKVGRLYNCAPEESRRRQLEEGRLHYVIFDVLCYEGEDLRDMPLRERIEYRDDALVLLQEQLASKRQHHQIFRTVRCVPTGDHPLDALRWIEKGLEGGIIKDLNDPYQSDGRPAGTWMKVKEQIELDLYITGYKEAKETSTKVDGTVSRTKFAGLVGSVELSAFDADSGEDTDICFASGIDDALRKQISWDRDGFLRRVVRVRAQRVTRDRKGQISLQNPRVLSFRDDKRPRECDYEELLRIARPT